MSQAVPLVKLSTKLFYSSGTIAFGIKDGGLAAFLMLYYNQVIGLSAGLVGTAIAIAMISDAIMNPIVGQISDRFRSKFGRRHPFMYATAVPAALGFIILWHPPQGLSHMGLFIFLTLATIFVRTCVTFFEVPNTALSAELTDDYDDRTKIFSYRIFFSTFGASAMLVLAYLVFLKPTAEYPVGQLNPEGYQHYAYAAAAVMLVTMLASALSTHHRIPYFRGQTGARSTGLRAILAEMVISIRNPSFLPILGAALCHAAALGLGAAMYIYIFTFFWGFSAGELSIMMIPNIVGAVLGMAIAPHVSRKIGKKSGAIILKALTVLAFVLPILLRLVGLFPENGAPSLLPLLVVFALVANTLGLSATMLNGSMIADIVEDDELKTGRRSEGLFFSMQDFVAKAVSGLGVFLSGLVLTIVAFPKGAKPGEVDPVTVANLGWTYMAVIGGLYFAAIFFLSRYRISREKHLENLQRLEVVNATAIADAPEGIAPGVALPEQPRPRGSLRR